MVLIAMTYEVMSIAVKLWVLLYKYYYYY